MQGTEEKNSQHLVLSSGERREEYLSRDFLKGSIILLQIICVTVCPGSKSHGVQRVLRFLPRSSSNVMSQAKASLASPATTVCLSWWALASTHVRR